MRKKRYIGLLGRYGRAIRGFPGSLPGSGTQLPENRHRNPFYRAGLKMRYDVGIWLTMEVDS